MNVAPRTVGVALLLFAAAGMARAADVTIYRTLASFTVSGGADPSTELEQRILAFLDPVELSGGDSVTLVVSIPDGVEIVPQPGATTFIGFTINIHLDEPNDLTLTPGAGAVFGFGETANFAATSLPASFLIWKGPLEPNEKWRGVQLHRSSGDLPYNELAVDSAAPGSFKEFRATFQVPAGLPTKTFPRVVVAITVHASSPTPVSGPLIRPVDRRAAAIRALGALATRVIELDIRMGIATSLDAKLTAAVAALDDLKAGNDAAALRALEAFIHELEAQIGKQIEWHTASDLIAEARRIAGHISGP
jgi:hypothetical protein